MARVEYEIGTNIVYGAIHEFGGTIYPRRGSYLVFQVNGQWVRATKVTIPARPYLRPALEQNIDRVVDEMSRILKQQIEKAIR